MFRPAYLLMLTLLLTSTLSIHITVPVVEAQTYLKGRYYLVPSENVFHAKETSIGTRFNVTFYAFNLSECDGFEFKVYCDPTMLNITGAWLPRSNPSWIFYGHSTFGLMPYFGEDLNGYYALVGDALIFEPAFAASGIMGIVEFNVTAKPTAGIWSCALNITNEDSYWIDDYSNAYYPERENGYYEISNRGPQMDSLYVRYYADGSAVYDALKNGTVDLTDLILNQARIDEVFDNTHIQAAISPYSAIFQFDVNNNAITPTYPDWASPTSYKGFRQGIACLVDKNHIVRDICNYSYRIDTPVPRPNYEWWVDPSVSAYDQYGNPTGNYPYEYNSTKAAHYFDQAGFTQGETTNPYYDAGFPSSAQYLRTYPASHPKEGSNLDPLIFYIRSDDPRRLTAGRLLRDTLRKMGIPVSATEATSSLCRIKVITNRDYHIYTGGWSGVVAPGFLEVYSSDYYYNYIQFTNATYDEWCEKAIHPNNVTIAREAALQCQKILIQEAATIWLWTPSSVMGYRNIFGVVNLRGGRIDNKWTFLKARNNTRGDIYYGLQMPPNALNIVTNYVYSPEKSCFDQIYDTLISYCPYDITPDNVLNERDAGGTMPWMAEDWEIGEWESPYNSSERLTKLTFYLRDRIKWHDGAELNSSDVKFTIEYLKGLGPEITPTYYLVEDVHHVTTPDARTVVVYESVSNIWTLNNIGTVPILPKHVFQNINNVTGYTPGADEGHLANETMIGSGAWKYVFHNSSTLILEANRDYFMETPPREEIDFRYDWETGHWAVDMMDITMVAEAFGCSGNNVPSSKWEPGCDLDGNCIVNIADVMLVALKFKTVWNEAAKHPIPTPATNCTVYIEHNNPILVGQNLTVYVKLANFTKLSGAQFKLNYDNTKLDCLKLEVNQIFGTNATEIKEINQTGAYVWVSVSSRGSPISGNTTLATITFNATKPSGSMLDLLSTKLAVYGAPGATCQLMTHESLDKGVMVAVSTPAGSNVSVAPAENTLVTFDNTTSGGITTLNVTQSPSAEFTSIQCNDIKTTASYTGNITLQFNYDPAGLSLEDEESLKIWLWNEVSKAWVDITSSVDTDNNIIYGVAPHLSIFGITREVSLEGTIYGDGEISANDPSTKPDPPQNLAAVNYYEINVTRSYMPPIKVHILYDDTGMTQEEEQFVKIWRWNKQLSIWVDITTSINTTSNVVTGTTTEFSIFGITCLKNSPTRINIIEVSGPKSIVCQGFLATMNVTVENGNDFTQDFTIVAYANSTKVCTQDVEDLLPHAQRKIVLTIDTIGLEKGNYAISVWSRGMPWINVTMVGDLTCDGMVDIVDIAMAAYAFGSSPGHPRWDIICDVTNDNTIDIVDVAVVAYEFGKVDP